MSPRRGQSRTTWPIALLAMLALLVQALVPAAMAYEARTGQSIVICTAGGARTVAADGREQPAKKGFGGLPCYQCVAASLAVTDTTGVQVSAPVLYVARVETAPPMARRGMAPARAPPRPPGQGPPYHLNG